MNGAEALMQTARDAGIDICFANPGTTEMPLVAAMDRVPGIRAILGLFEGVCTGAADGYGRMTGRPAMTLLHLGPGFANGIANLHNARRARSPIVNLVGDHTTGHVAFDAPLTSDIVSLAQPVSGWVRSNTSSAGLPEDFAAAAAAAAGPPCRVATLIVPADCQWDPAAGPTEVPEPAAASTDIARIEAAAGNLRGAAQPMLLLGGDALRERGLRAAVRVASVSGARVLSETFPARVDRGVGLPPVTRLPYFPEQAIESLAGVDALVLAGARDPVAFFGYPNVPSRLAPADARVRALTAEGENAAAALEQLADALAAPASAEGPPNPALPAPPADGPLDPAAIGALLARAQPADAIIGDEGATSSLPYTLAANAAAPHTALGLTGGAIGQGLPVAVGAAVACPDRKVIAIQADGSGLYTLQSLWTLARESLDVTVLICSNRRYRILQVELQRAGVALPGPNADSLTDLSRPDIDWVGLGRSLGVPSARAATVAALTRELDAALAERGPRLIELVL
ncbi:MAG: acetolactate synthase large subunit [Myxococcota bacterium]